VVWIEPSLLFPLQPLVRGNNGACSQDHHLLIPHSNRELFGNQLSTRIANITKITGALCISIVLTGEWLAAAIWIGHGWGKGCASFRAILV
jgi:hypothetical protein